MSVKVRTIVLGLSPARQGRPQLCSSVAAEELGAVAAYEAPPLSSCNRSMSRYFRVPHLVPAT